MDVKITASALADGTIGWDIDGKKPKDSRITLGAGSGKHQLDFRLKDDAEGGLAFNVDDPIWVGEDCPCPPPQGLNTDQIEVVDCSPGKLSVIDSNSGRARELRYQLNFISADGRPAKCDPVITNGGGGSG